jgi:hypothetical protein
MHKLIALLITCFALNISLFAQESIDQTPEGEPLLSITIGDAELIDITKAYLVKGRKVERTFQSDYYESAGVLSLAEGKWSLVASGLGGKNQTTHTGDDFPSADVEIQASPNRCFASIRSGPGKAFEIQCPLRSLRIRIRSDSLQTLLLIRQLSPNSQNSGSLTAADADSPTFAPSPTITENDSLTEISLAIPTEEPTITSTPSRTPFPTADPESGTYYVSGAGGANVRSCASTSCAIESTFQFGKTLSVTGFEDGQNIGGNSRWARTISGDYIHSSLLTRGSPPATATPQINLQSILNSALDSVVDSVTVTLSSRNVLIKTSLLHGDSDTLAEAAIRDIGRSICLLKINGFSSYKLTFMGSHQADSEPYSIKFRSRSGTTSNFRCPVRQLSVEVLLERLQSIEEFSDVSDWLMSMTSLGW